MDFKNLLNESVSDDVIEQLENGLSNTIENIINEKDEELNDVEQILTERAESYAQERVNETTALLTEKANNYTQMVVTQLKESFSEREAAYAQEIQDLKEKAEGYAEMIFDDVVQKANDYTQQFVQEYTQQNKAMFESIQQETTAKDIVESINGVLQSFGFDTDQNAHIKSLESKLTESQTKVSELENKLNESLLNNKKQQIIDNLTSDLSLSEKENIVKASQGIITESIDDFERVVNVLVSNYNIKHNENKKINENVNTINNTNSDKSLIEKTLNKTKPASDIASMIV